MGQSLERESARVTTATTAAAAAAAAAATTAATPTTTHHRLGSLRLADAHRAGPAAAK